MEFEVSTKEAGGKAATATWTPTCTCGRGETYAGFAIVDNERKQPYRYRPNYSWTAPGFEVELGPGAYTV